MDDRPGPADWLAALFLAPTVLGVGAVIGAWPAAQAVRIFRWAVGLG